jgi:hypothetical protein
MNNQLSKKLMDSVPVLRDGQFKVFRLVTSGHVDSRMQVTLRDSPDEVVETMITRNAGAYFEGKFFIYDRYEPDPTKKKKVIMNVVGTELVTRDGRTSIEDKAGAIEFDNSGQCIVNWMDYQKLVCMTLADENKSNPHRDPRVIPLWEEVPGLEKAAEATMINDDWETDARVIIKEADMDALVAIAIYNNIPIPAEGPAKYSVLKNACMARAKAAPKDIIKGSLNVDLKMKVQIEDAVNFTTIKFDDIDNTWVFDDGKDGEVICKVGAVEDKYKAIFKAISTNKEHYRKMVNGNKAYLKAKERQIV